MKRFFSLLLCLGFTVKLVGADLRHLSFALQPDFTTQSITGTLTQQWQCAENDTFSLFYPASLYIVAVDAPAELSYTQQDTRLKFKCRNSGRFSFTIRYRGKGLEAINPPWDGGLVWRKDAQGNPWLGSACQGVGASAWWPAPAEYTQEADTVLFTCTYPSGLFFKGNGKMINDRIDGALRTTTWQTSHPINLYNITINIGQYAHFSEVLKRPDGSTLQVDYYPLAANLGKARKQFRQTLPMLRIFERAFGNYPCSNDGFSVVETAYVGMEHQGAIAYGNGYRDGYKSDDYSGVGIWFDFILIHESGHEWWGNSVSAKTPRDFWIHEAFCTYAEMIYVRDRFGIPASIRYINAKKRLVKNQHAILSKDNHDIDMYAKGALMIYSLSRYAKNLNSWNALLREFALSHQFKLITTEELINWFCLRLPGLHPDFFKQYLEMAEAPKLSYAVKPVENGYTIEFRILNALPGFQLPIEWKQGKKTYSCMAGATLQTLTFMGKIKPQPDTTFSYFIPTQ